MTLRLGIASGDWLHPDRTGREDPVWGGSGWARLGQYADLLPFEVSVGTLVWFKDRFVIVDVYNDTYEVDIVYMQRLMHDGLRQHVPMARASGQKIINDLDDWYWGLSTSNMAYRHNHPSTNKMENTNFYKTIIAKSDLVTVSTSYLADRISSFVKCPIHVLHNTVDISKFSSYNHVDTPIPEVGWIGSTLHRSNDIETIAGTVGAMAKANKIKLFHGGHHEGAHTFASRLKVPEELVRVEELRTPDLYPELMQMDIGIVPLNNTPFNMAKSDIKGLEYSAAGIPFVAQNLPAYEALHKTNKVGLVAKKPSDWIKHLTTLSNYKVRSEMGSMSRELIANRDLKYGLKNIIEVIESV